MRSLKKNNLLNSIEWVKDGVEALDFIFPDYVQSSAKIEKLNLPC
jgi:hypothetical protein